jgi:3',5'-cyclic AMP phosphodiesterase CpdA
MLAPHHLYQQIISPELNPVLRVGKAVIAGIDSTSPHTAISNGRIFRRQLEMCVELFRNAPADAIRIVVAHHPFAPAPDCLRDKRVQRAVRAMKVFRELEIELILGGHLHRAYTGNSIDFYPATRRDRGIHIVHCGTTTSRRGRGREMGRNSLNLIEFRKKTLTVSHFLFRDESDSFTLESIHTFQRRPSD